MNIKDVLEQLNDISEIQCSIVGMIHIQGLTARQVAQTLHMPLDKVSFQETIAFKNMVTIMLGADSFKKAAQEWAAGVAKQVDKENKKATAAATKAAKGTTMEREKGTPRAG